MRKIHRTVGLFFAPFLATTAVTGLLWAYAPYLYMKNEPTKIKAPAIDENRTYLPLADVIRSAKMLAGEGKVLNVTLKPDAGRLVYSVNIGSRSGRKEVQVDAKTGKAEIPVRTKAQEFQQWIMRIHRLEFFGTKKELVAIPGLGLLTLLVTGSFLLRKKVK